MPEQTLSEKLAQSQHALRFEQLPEAVVETAKQHILDSLGCLLAGSRLEPGKSAYNLVAALGSNPAAAGSFLDTVQAMATAAHCGELDDIHGGAATCIGALVVPALIGLAQRHGGTGKKFIAATVVGYESIIRAGLSIDAPRLFARGWWPSTICGALGVAAAGAKFLGYAADQTANALGIAALHSGGLITGGSEGATARHLAFGQAARSGVLALFAAQQGFTGPKRAFEDPRGFCLTLCAEPKWEFLNDLERYYLTEVAIKPYPCARQLHAGVEALLKILGARSLAPSAIEAIELAVPTQNAAMVDRPSTLARRAATLGSGQYVMAVTALRGKMDLACFEAPFLESEAVHRLCGQVRVAGSADLDRYFPSHWSGRVTVKTKNGESFAEQVIIPKGDDGNPMSAAEVEEKFLSLAEPVLGQEAAAALAQAVHLLDRPDSLARLIEALSSAPGV